MAKVLRSQEFSVAEAGPGGRREAVPKFLDVTRNRLEPFPGLRRLIVNPADMARIYSPDRRSRPPDPLRRSTRPARISPSGRVSFWGTPSRRQASFPHAEAVHARLSLSPRPETNYDSLVIRVCRPGTTHCLPRCCFCVPSNDATIRSRRATAQGFLMSVPPPAHALDEVA